MIFLEQILSFVISLRNSKKEYKEAKSKEKDKWAMKERKKVTDQCRIKQQVLFSYLVVKA